MKSCGFEANLFVVWTDDLRISSKMKDMLQTGFIVRTKGFLTLCKCMNKLICITMYH